jgi:hypothetical protein
MPVYPLKQVLTVKERRVDEAQKILREKINALTKEQEKLKQREKERDSVLTHKRDKLKQLRAEMDHNTTTAKIQQMKAYLKVVDERLKTEEKKVKEQQEQVNLAMKNVEAAREDLRLKELEVDKIELHRKDWEKAVRAEMQLAEEREQDEIGNITHLLHQRQGLTQL